MLGAVIGSVVFDWRDFTAWLRGSSTDGALLHVEHLPAQQDRQPVILTAGDEHLPPGNAVEDKFLPPGIQLAEYIV